MARYFTMHAWAHYEEDGNYLISVSTVRPSDKDVRPGDILHQVNILVPELPEEI